GGERRGPPPGQAEAGQVGRGELLGGGEQVVEGGVIGGGAGPPRDPAEQGAGAGHGDLLAYDGAYGQFEAVPRAGYAQPGTFLRPRAERGGRERAGDRVGVGVQVEQATGAGDDPGQAARGGDRGDQVHVPVRGGEADPAAGDGAGVAVLVHPFQAGDGAYGQETQEGVGVEREAVVQPQGEGERALGEAPLRGAVRGARVPRPPVSASGLRRSGARSAGARGGAQLTGREAVRLLHGRVELADAAEPRGERDVRDRQRRLGEQLLGQQQPPRSGHGQGTDPQLGDEQAVQVAFG